MKERRRRSFSSSHLRRWSDTIERNISGSILIG